MTQIICLGFIFCMISFLGRTTSQCQNPYLDLCSINGRSYEKTEDENENYICDCRQVMYCSVIELSEECNTARVKFVIDADVTEPECVVTSLEAVDDILPYKIIEKNENEFLLEVFTEFHFGRYKVICDVLDIPQEFTTPNYTQWEILSINPTEVVVDSQVTLQVIVTSKPDLSSTSAWCFLNSPDKSLEVLKSSWVSETQINCLDFEPKTPGTFAISLSSSVTSNVLEKAVNVKVTSKRPVAEQAEYNSDFKNIFIHFDANIQLHSTCENVFSKNFQDNFGVGFNCYIKGNILVIKMGQEHKIINTIEIKPDNKILHAGCQTAEFCLSSQPVNLRILKPKVSDPNLSFYVSSPCEGNSTLKHMSVRVIPSRQSNFPSQNQTKPKTSGKVQRKNLMSWRLMREVQSRFSSQLVFQLNETDVQPLYNTLPSLVNAVDVDHLSFTARVFVSVQSSAATVLAEANVTFCGGFTKLFLYKWIVNGKDVHEDGKLLILRDLTPGKYVIECVATANDSEEVLGQGWTTTEVIPVEEKVIVVPLETTAGTMDDIFLRAVTWHGDTVTWTCRKDTDEVCLTNDRKLVRDVIGLNSPNISIPAGTLPAGVYTWTVEDARGLNKARVVVKTGSSPSVRVESPVIVKPFQEVVLRGILRRMRGVCRTWWTSVQEKGFSYFNLVEVVSDTSRESSEIPLVIPSEKWKPFGPDSLYLFQLHVFCPSNLNGSYDYVKVPLLVNDPPRVSVLTVEPLIGAAMITNFVVSGAKADSSYDDYPLIYEWSYVDPCDVEVPIKRGVSSMNFTTYLPPGDLKLMVRVCNGKNICSTTTSPTITVIQESEFPAHNFQNARNEIQKLLTSGDILEGFGLATTVFKSLALLAETETREGMYSTVENAIENRIKILTRRVQSETGMIHTCSEFFERAVAVAKYLRYGSPIMKHLMEFRETVLKIHVRKAEKQWDRESET